jgi:predicted Rossmann fold flavoprotein
LTTQLGIVGAGPAGMMAALQATAEGARVLLFDSNPTPGRKLLVTGSGRCNITNANAVAERYACADPAWMAQVLAQFGHADLRTFLAEIGILTYATPDGWCYPLSESAQTVVDAFTAALALANVELHAGTKIKNIRSSKNGFILVAEGNETFTVERLVLAAGGKAYPTLGSTGELFPALERLGHHVLPVLPALAPVLAELGPFRKLQGVRLDVQASLWDGKTRLAETSGNLIITEWGFNGPAVMDLSHLVSTHPNRNLHLELNLLAANEAALRSLIERKRCLPIPLSVVLEAVLPPKVPSVFLKTAGLSADVLLKEISEEKLQSLLYLLTHVSVAVKSTRGFEYCQLKTGGVPVTEVDPASMASRFVPGLYLAGEVVDVVGPCGGYNLQFAFSSGAIAGKAAGKSYLELNQNRAL